MEISGLVPEKDPYNEFLYRLQTEAPWPEIVHVSGSEYCIPCRRWNQEGHWTAESHEAKIIAARETWRFRSDHTMVLGPGSILCEPCTQWREKPVWIQTTWDEHHQSKKHQEAIENYSPPRTWADRVKRIENEALEETAPATLFTNIFGWAPTAEEVLPRRNITLNESTEADTAHLIPQPPRARPAAPPPQKKGDAMDIVTETSSSESDTDKRRPRGKKAEGHPEPEGKGKPQKDNKT